MELELERLTRIFQASISPVALISGVGLLILSLTNRFGRVTDRLRDLADADQLPQQKKEAEIRIFEARAGLLRWSITCAVTSVLVTSVLVLFLFATAVFHARLQLIIYALFAFSLIALIACLVLFLRDMQLSLRAVKEHLRP